PTMARRSAIPVGIRKVHGRFERWRKSHIGRLPIPERLWRAAAELAKEHGVCRTAQVLRLEYGKLKRLAETAGRNGRSRLAHNQVEAATNIFCGTGGTADHRCIGVRYRTGRT